MRKAATILLSLGLAACAGAPGYRASEVTVPPAFRERDSTRRPALPAETGADSDQRAAGGAAGGESGRGILAGRSAIRRSTA